jgi:hypothetical protein
MGNALLAPQAETLAPPSEKADIPESADDIIDLDAGDSLLDSKPDDGKDTSDGGDAPPPSDDSEDEDQDDAPEDGADDEEAELAALAAAEPEKPAKRSGISRLKAQLAETQAEVARLRQAVPRIDEAAELAAGIEREIGPAPKESDYPDYVAYDRALIVYENAKFTVSRELRKAAETARIAIAQQQQATVDTYLERIGEASKSIKDFNAVMQAATVSPSHRDTVLLIMESEKSPQLAYYLAKHPEKVHELNGMTPRRQAAEIGRLEARLSTVAPKKETKAPSPVPALKGGMTSTDKDPEKMSMDDFAKWFDNKKRSNGG